MASVPPQLRWYLEAVREWLFSLPLLAGRQAQIIILEILKCIPVVIIFAFLDLGKNISFSESLLGIRYGVLV
jgi:hypothetical protein